jgi:hypothetical protein
MKRGHICLIATIVAAGTGVVAATPQAGPEHARLTASGDQYTRKAK